MVKDSVDTSPDTASVEHLWGHSCFVISDVDAYLAILNGRDHASGWNERSIEDVLEMLGAITSDGNNIHPTRAGLLMFGKVSYILREFPYYHLDYIETDVDGRWTYRLNSDDLRINLNLFTFTREVLHRISFKIGTPFKLEGICRVEDSEVIMAVREIIVNALIHADYLGQGGIRITYDGGKVIVRNAGTMSIPLEIAMKGGVSDPRNMLVMRMMSNIGMAERIGSGLCAAFETVADGSVLDISVEESVRPDSVTATITLQVPGPKVDMREAAVLRYISSNPTASMQEISRNTEISSRTLSRIVAELVEKGVLVRQGTYRNNRWSLKRRCGRRTKWFGGGSPRPWIIPPRRTSHRTWDSAGRSRGRWLRTRSTRRSRR